MRKILLATPALAAFMVAGAAQAATSPITVNVGGSVDFLAANSAEHGSVANKSSNRDFETVYNLDFSILGKAMNGVEYGGVLNLTNTADASNGLEGNRGTPFLNAGYVWMSGQFGKVQLGDSHGATDLNVGTPTVGEGQVTGRFVDFLDTASFAKGFVYGVDGIEHSTGITYFTPKVGNANNKVQVGVTYIPQFYDFGASVVNYNNSTGAPSAGGVANYNNQSPYHDVVKGAVAYTGNYDNVALGASAHIITGSSSDTTGVNSFWTGTAPAGTPVSGFTSWGLGAQAALDGFTLGATYTDLGDYDTVAGQGKDQRTYGAGLKYEFNKVAVGVSYLGGEGYANTLGTGATASANTYNYVGAYNSYGAGGSYTWAPGLSTNLDGVYFNQKQDSGVSNDGYVLLVSQKLAF